MSYSSVDQQAQLLAQEASSLLPGHPAGALAGSLAQIRPIGPDHQRVVAARRRRNPSPRAGRGAAPAHCSSRPGTRRSPTSPRSWGCFAATSGRRIEGGLPPWSRSTRAASSHPPSALPDFLQSLRQSAPIPGRDRRSGRLADGYGVQDEPWLVLASPEGGVLWYYDISTLWMAGNERAPRAAFEPPCPVSRRPERNRPVVARRLAAGAGGDPPPGRAAARRRAALSTRLRALRGYPVVVNAWASWCAPCRAEFGLLASASARYGREVAFLGVDTSDSPGDARSFLLAHPVSYPSYQSSISALSSTAVIEGLPTTIFINPAGKVVYVHTGQYDAEGTLDEDIARYLLRP